MLKRRHSGGTSHKEVFEKVMQYIKTGNGEETSVYIGITDMDSDIRNVKKLLAPWMPRIYLTRNKSLPKGIIGKVINFISNYSAADSHRPVRLWRMNAVGIGKNQTTKPRSLFLVPMLQRGNQYGTHSHAGTWE